MKSAIISLLLAGASGIACYLVAGNSLDLFIGSVFFAAIVAGQSPGDWGSVFGITIGISFCWWMPVHAETISATQWGSCVAIFFTFIAAMAMTIRVLQVLSPVVATAIVTSISLAWLSWPVWLQANQPHASILFHPLFAINHVVSDLGIWTEQQAAYGMTTLGQDASYQLPYSAWPVIGLQAVVTLLLFFLVSWKARQPVELDAEPAEVSEPLPPVD